MLAQPIAQPEEATTWIRAEFGNLYHDVTKNFSDQANAFALLQDSVANAHEQSEKLTDENHAKEARIIQMEEALVREGERVQRLRDEHEGIEHQTKALVDQEQQLMARREAELNKFAARLAMSSVSKEPELIPEVRMLLESFEELLSKLVQADAFDMLRLGTNLHGFDNVMRHYEHVMRRLNLPHAAC